MVEKMQVYFGILLFIFIFSEFGYSQEGDKLISTVIIYRHGYRTPIDPYPNDPYRNLSFWPEGLGELTNLGKLQQYELGKWLRKRYNQLLPLMYFPTDIYVHSTDTDRTLMSAEANLAALYPPVQIQVWNPKLRWQPIPVHTIPLKEDDVLSMFKSCPRWDELQKELFESPLFKNISHQLHDLYYYLSKQSGRSVYSLKTLEYLYNTLFIEELSNLTLPNWTHSVYPTKMKPWAAMSFATNTFTKELARLRVGPLMHEIIEHFNNVTRNGSATYYKARVYSAHDTTLADVLNSLGLFEYHNPPFCSMILLEMKQRDSGYYINIYYKNSTVPLNMTLKGCDFDCPYDRFVDLLKPITLSSEERVRECVTGFRRFLHSNSLLVMIMISLWLAVFLIVVGLYAAAKYFNNKDTDAVYIQIPSDEVS